MTLTSYVDIAHPLPLLYHALFSNYMFACRLTVSPVCHPPQMITGRASQVRLATIKQRQMVEPEVGGQS